MKRGPRIDLGGMPAVEGLPEEDQIERCGRAGRPGGPSHHRVKGRSVRKEIVAKCQLRL